MSDDYTETSVYLHDYKILEFVECCKTCKNIVGVVGVVNASYTCPYQNGEVVLNGKCSEWVAKNG